MYSLQIKNLNVRYKNFQLKDVNLNIARGTIVGLVGRNGAGKTTLIKAIMRQLTVDDKAVDGQILYDDMLYAENEVEVLRRLACVFDAPHFALTAKPKTVLSYYKKAFPDFDEQRYYALMEKFKLPQNQRIAKYSFGMQRKYCLILALCQGASILILDEPTAGIDPFDRQEVVSLIQDFMLDESHTVLFSTHITEDLDKIADDIVMMEDGKVVFHQDKVSLTEHYRMVQTATMTDELQKIAIGVKSGAFGYTFLTQDVNIGGDGVLVKVPSVEELFLHLTGEGAVGFSQLAQNQRGDKA